MHDTDLYSSTNKPDYPRNKKLGLHVSSFFFCSDRFSFVPRGGSPVLLRRRCAGTGTRAPAAPAAGFSFSRSLARSLGCSLSLCFSLFLSLVLSLGLVFSLSFALVLPSLVPFPIVFCLSPPNLLSVAMIFCFSYFLSVVFATKTLS